VVLVVVLMVLVVLVVVLVMLLPHPPLPLAVIRHKQMPLDWLAFGAYVV
jgi:hypothetical protein